MGEAAAVSPGMLILPTSPAAANKDWRDQRILMLGPAGCGKSTFWNRERTLYLDSEGGLGHLPVMSLPAHDWDQVRQAVTALTAAAKAGTFPYDTIVVDTLDHFLAAAELMVVAKMREAHKNQTYRSIGDVANGAGWSGAANAYQTCLRTLDQLPAALVLIGHVKQEKRNAGAAEYSQETLALWGQLKTWTLGWVHHTLHLQVTVQGDRIGRKVRTLPCQGMEGKSHGGLVKDHWEWQTRDLAKEYGELRGWFT